MERWISNYMRVFYLVLVLCLLFVGCDRKESAKSLNFEKSLNFHISKGEGKISNISLDNNKPIVINFFTTTCGGCKEELPGLVKLQNKYGDKINFIGVLGERIDKKVALKFLNKYNINYPIINQSRQVQILSDAVGGVFGVPITVVFDKNGKLIKKFLGVVPMSTLTKSFRGYM